MATLTLDEVVARVVDEDATDQIALVVLAVEFEESERKL